MSTDHSHHTSDEVTTLELKIDGMTCAHCAEAVSRTLKSFGLQNVAVNAASGTAIANGETPDSTTLAAALKKLGFRLVDQSSSRTTSWWIQNQLEIKLAVSALCTVPLMSHMVTSHGLFHHPGVQLLLATPAIIIGLAHFGKSAWRSLKALNPNMDVLIILGIMAAFTYSVAGVFLGLGEDFLFFETAASITTFVLLGNFIEHRTLKKTTSAIEELNALQPQRATRVVVKDSSESFESVPVQEIQVGETLNVALGEQFPTDGEILSGTALVNESIVSGESVPRRRTTGDKVIGGTLVIDGTVRMRVESIGEKTVLQQMIRLVKQATANKPQIQRLGDTVSSIFVPIVSIIALLTFVLGLAIFDLSLQQALLQSIAVMVVACPCAMGLATPTAVSVGVGRAARNGILVKGGRILEQLSTVKSFIFDKTGTLTAGSFSINSFEVFSGDTEEIKSALIALESRSTHPIARSLVQSMKGHPPLTLTEIREEKGLGISGKDSHGKLWKIGTPAYALATPEQHAHWDLIISEENQPRAGLLIEDELKPDTEKTLSTLRSHGYLLSILSGDRKEKVERTAQRLQITSFYAAQSPEQKLAIIQKSTEKMPTCYVGDGVNDAASLARASVGVSLGGATHAAIQSSDVVLLDGKLESLVEASRIAQLTMKTIKENLFWAFFYNVLTIPLAACGYLTPLVAALSMSFSDVIVIGNSIRLRFRK